MNSMRISLLHRPAAALAVAAGLLAAAVLFLLMLGSEIAERETEIFDRAVLQWLRDMFGSYSGLKRVMLDITALGDTIVLTFTVLAVTGFLLTLRRYRLAGILIVQAAVGTSLASLAKLWFARARPSIIEHWAEVSSASFPSGHAANSAVVYFALAILAGRAVPTAAGRCYLLGIAAALVAAIGVSRMYLGVHWPTDVIAGWALGGSWAIFGWVVTERLAPRVSSDRFVSRNPA
ncbi:MAG: phosphatase family protein [Sphingomonas bacterium]|uniref:phosphatase PAP2 family protein n=1 Tax=Sphingomonas bacterium TaxID=1895847 RepID=UPI002614A5C0|nr:phosphatase PAP2 family protein [Sphingomonas bacterium]MDB5694795.1 phosphatase family protein [Sphingomonas bacterium]